MRYLIVLVLLSLNAFSARAQKVAVSINNEPAAPIYSFVEQLPSPSFDVAKYLSENIKYPKKALEDNVEGRVTLKFVVNEDGTLSDVNVVRGISKECDEEAVRVLKSMPAWKPGKQNSKPVKVFFTLPIVFKLTAQTK